MYHAGSTTGESYTVYILHQSAKRRVLDRMLDRSVVLQAFVLPRTMMICVLYYSADMLASSVEATRPGTIVPWYFCI